MPIVDWIHCDSEAVLDSLIVCHRLEYMQYADGMLNDLIGMMDPERDEFVIRNMKQEKERRRKLDE